MALVKSDIGGNISVGFCHPFLSYVLLFFWYIWVIICMLAALYAILLICFLFFLITCYGYRVLPYLKHDLGVDHFSISCGWLVYTCSCFTFYTTFSMDYVPEPLILVQNFKCYMFSLYNALTFKAEIGI